MSIKTQYQGAVNANFLNVDKFGETVILVNPAAVEKTVLAVIEWIPEVDDHVINDGEFREKSAIVSISTLASNGVVGVTLEWTMKVNGATYAIEQINPDEFGMMDIQIKKRPIDTEGDRRRED